MSSMMQQAKQHDVIDKHIVGITHIKPTIADAYTKMKTTRYPNGVFQSNGNLLQKFEVHYFFAICFWLSVALLTKPGKVIHKLHH